MESIKLNNAVYICEELGFNCNIVSNDNNDNPITSLIITLDNGYIVLANYGNMYYIIIRYYNDNESITKSYTNQYFTGDNLRALLQLVYGRPIHEIFEDGEVEWFFAGLE